jgi:hypothetical protein
LWTSAQELGLFMILFIVFCTSPSELVLIWLFTPHLLRSVVGLVIVLKKGLPTSEQIIENVSIPDLETVTLD